jgi:glycosyltransferase involved in cell wall biosynthesis
MQEIKKRRIVIASVLKPVDDPRMFEKIGMSLSRQYKVHIFGTSATNSVDSEDIFFHPIAKYDRLNLKRLLTPIRILKSILNLKPSVVIICTHELLWMVLVARVFTGCRVVYDIRENYYRNILHTTAFPPIIRVFVALYVRIKEWITSPIADRFFLAEAGYAREISFADGRSIILENKLKKIDVTTSKKWSAGDGNFHLLFSGTLAPSTGVFVAIQLAKALHTADEKIRLHIVGFSPMHSVRHEITKEIAGCSYIHFFEYAQPVPHTEILRAIQHADMGIIAYPPNLSTKNTIPTKLFEYLGYALPILLINHPVWVKMCAPYPAAIAFDASNVDAKNLLDSIRNTRFYEKHVDDIFWESEEKKLLQSISLLIK